jgi:D-alanyl-D-alanine carboxypeptidase
VITDPTPVHPMQSNSQRRSRSGQANGAADDDIPLARRVTPRSPSTNPWLVRLGLTCGAVALLAGSLALIFPQPLRRWLAPPPVAGLAARPGLDGRLLGHFRYDQVPESQLLEVAPGQRLHRDAARELLAMLTAARADGVDLVVLSAYRSMEEQKALFFDVKAERNQSARERAQVSAPPGFSEHSTGYAVDLGDGAAPGSNLSTSFDQTAAFAWLKANAQRYHFTLSFPPDNPQGVSYEPWHWRFEGTATALKVFEPAGRFANR